MLKNLGYTTHAVHNNEANFYGRRSIFPNLGFDTFTSAEYMTEEEDKNPLGWTKDEVLSSEILKCLDSSEGPDYIYTISVQGHVLILRKNFWMIRRSQLLEQLQKRRIISGNIM